MKIETYKFIMEVLKNRAVKDVIINFSNGDSIIDLKDNNDVIVYLNEGYIDVYNDGNNKYYAIDQIVSIEKYTSTEK